MITEHLVEHPTALVDGDSSAPAPVARLIAELIAAGVEGLRCLAVLTAVRRSRWLEGCQAARSATAA